MGDQRVNWWVSPRLLLRQILLLDDTPHSISMGVAVGMFIGMTPTVGIQMILVMIFAVITRPLFQFSRVAALITVYISNPVTVLPIYWFNYKVGTVFFEGHVSYGELESVLFPDATAGVWHRVWGTLVTLFVDIGEPLIVGSLFVATVCAVASYPFMRWLLKDRPQESQGANGDSPPASGAGSESDTMAAMKDASGNDS